MFKSSEKTDLSVTPVGRLNPFNAGIIIPVLVLVAWGFLFMGLRIEEALLQGGFLNKTDLIPVGPEHGTVRDYLRNVWFWDAMLLCILLLAIFLSCTFIFYWLFKRRVKWERPTG